MRARRDCEKEATQYKQTKIVVDVQRAAKRTTEKKDGTLASLAKINWGGWEEVAGDAPKRAQKEALY